MGARWRTGKAVLVAAALCAVARAEASVQVDPVARLSLEGGYDSNVLYNGQGGDSVGRVSPDLGVKLRDHTWNLDVMAGGDLLLYPNRSTTTAWNQRGSLALKLRATERLTVEAGASGTYAFDPLGLARMGLFANGGGAVVGAGRVKASYRLDHAWTVAPLFEEHVVRYDGGTGAASHTPGVELTRHLGHRLEVGGVYRFDWFQGIGRGTGDAHAHEAQGVARYRLARRMDLEVQAGAAFWSGPTGDSAVVPQASIQLVSMWRGGGMRVGARHGVGLGLTATPGLFDTLEAGITTHLGRHFQMHADGGLWRSGAIPWGAGGVLGYGVEGSFDYRAMTGVLIGVGASRFARVDVSAPQYDRNILGLHVTWALEQRGER